MTTEASPTRVRYHINVLLLLLTAITYLDRVCISRLGKPIKAELGLS